ncbi:hypothetical protein Tco_1024293 [Tanacetum coccineum]
MVGFGGDDEGDDDGMMRVVALLLWLPDGEEKRRVKESVYGDRVSGKTKKLYRQLRIVLSVENKLDYLEQPFPPAHVPAQAGQQVAPEALTAHAAWVKGSKEITGIMLMTMGPDIQLDLENLSAYDYGSSL